MIFKIGNLKILTRNNFLAEDDDDIYKRGIHPCPSFLSSLPAEHSSSAAWKQTDFSRYSQSL